MPSIVMPLGRSKAPAGFRQLPCRHGTRQIRYPQRGTCSKSVVLHVHFRRHKDGIGDFPGVISWGFSDTRLGKHTQKTIENGNLQWIYPFKIVISIVTFTRGYLQGDTRRPWYHASKGFEGSNTENYELLTFKHIQTLECDYRKFGKKHDMDQPETTRVLKAMFKKNCLQNVTFSTTLRSKACQGLQDGWRTPRFQDSCVFIPK